MIINLNQCVCLGLVRICCPACCGFMNETFRKPILKLGVISFQVPWLKESSFVKRRMLQNV